MKENNLVGILFSTFTSVALAAEHLAVVGNGVDFESFY